MDDLEIVSGFDAIQRLEPLWMRLGARACAFNQFELAMASAQLATMRGAEPLVAVVRRDGVARTLLPLRRERQFGVRVAVPLLSPLAQYADVVGEALEPRDLVALSARLGKLGTDILLMRKVREDSGLHGALSLHGRSQHAGETAYYVDLSAFGTFAKYEASFSSRTRRNRRQRLQRFEAQEGALTFDVLRGEHALAAFDTALSWKRQWLSQRGVSSPIVDDADWLRILRGSVVSGLAMVTALRTERDLVAVEIGYADRGAYLAYLGAYDERFASFSLGQHQMLCTIGWCFEQGFTRYDLLAPADDYKRQLSRSGTSVSVEDYAIALTHVGRGVAKLRRHVRPLARDLYHKLSPEMRIAGGRYGVPAATLAAAAATAGAVLVAIE